MPYSQVVRVAVHNNFNCTNREFTQLNGFRKDFPDRYFFINTNINTSDILNLANHNYKAVITINPNILPVESEIKKLFKLDPQRVAFVRVKYIPNVKAITDLIKRLSTIGYNVVITLQRFNGKESLNQYSSLDSYEHTSNRYRLSDKPKKECIALARSLDHTYICDEKGIGCKGCGLCAKLTTGSIAPIKTLNLSSSGLCKFSCPDCYAHTLQHLSIARSVNPIKTDKIYTNDKQAGRTVHIQVMLQKLETEEIKL